MFINAVSPRRSLKSKLFYSAVVFVTVGITTWYGMADGYSSPRRTFDPIPSQVGSSSFVIPVIMNLDDLQRRLNEEVPGVLASVDENRDGCIPAKWAKVDAGLFKIKTKISPSIDCNLKGQASRGPISIGGNGKTLTINMPVTASVTAKGRGEIGKNVSVTASGAIEAVASVQTDIDGNWQPSATVGADYHWDRRIGVDILGFRITFADKVDPQLRKMIEGFQKKIPEALAKLALKEQASKLWTKSFTTLKLGGDPNIWVRLTPRAVGYNGYTVSGRELKFDLMVQGQTETFIGKKPEAAVATALPSLQRDFPRNGLNVFVPVSADYESLATAAKAALKIGEEQSFDLPGRGKVRATFRDVVIHQTDGRRLAVGVRLDTDVSVGFMNLSKAHGTVWLTADAHVDNQTKRAKIDHFEVRSRTDSPTADVLASVVNLPGVNQTLLGSLQYDFTAKYADAVRKVEQGINREVSPDIRLMGKVEGIEVQSISAGADALVANVTVRGAAELRTGKLVN